MRVPDESLYNLLKHFHQSTLISCNESVRLSTPQAEAAEEGSAKDVDIHRYGPLSTVTFNIPRSLPTEPAKRSHHALCSPGIARISSSTHPANSHPCCKSLSRWSNVGGIPASSHPISRTTPLGCGFQYLSHPPRAWLVGHPIYTLDQHICPLCLVSIA